MANETNGNPGSGAASHEPGRVRYAHLGTAEGMTLLSGEDPLDKLIQDDIWMRETKMKPEDLMPGLRLCSFPVPVYYSGDLIETPRRFSNVNPASMWHPLFWLPRSLFARYVMTDEAGEEVPEPIELWSVRIALALNISKLYHMEKGWVDILFFSGLDVNRKEDRDRIRAWQRGEDDEILDNIDLSDYLSAAPPEELMLLAQDMAPLLLDSHWNVVAASLLSHLSEAASQIGPDEVSHTIRVIAATADASFMDEDFIIPEGLEDPTEFWPRVEKESQDFLRFPSKESLIEGPYQEASDWLRAVCDAYREATMEVIETDAPPAPAMPLGGSTPTSSAPAAAGREEPSASDIQAKNAQDQSRAEQIRRAEQEALLSEQSEQLYRRRGRGRN